MFLQNFATVLVFLFFCFLILAADDNHTTLPPCRKFIKLRPRVIAIVKSLFFMELHSSNLMKSITQKLY